MSTFMRTSVLLWAGLAACYRPLVGTDGGTFTPDQHQVYFPITNGTHAGTDCNACHGAYDTFTRFSCITCHQHQQSVIDPTHLGLTGYSYSETSCYSCHPTGEGMSRAEHLWFPIVGGRHGTIGCRECHPTNHQSVACFECHQHTCAEMTPKHSEVGSFSCDSMRCYNCHPNGEVSN